MDMKNIGKYLARLFLVSGLIWITLIGFGQQAKLTKEGKKELRKKELDASYNKLDSLLNARRFVLAADFLQGRSGERIIVNSTLNFVKVKGETGVLQVGANTGVGYNGVGGVTAEGSIANWQLDKNDKNHTISVRFSISSSLGHYDVLMNVTVNNTSATISGLGSGSLTWTGHLESPEKSRVFQGQTNY
jgi:hypothetical protein